MKQAHKELKDPTMETRVQQGLENNGTLFAEIPEIYADFQPRVEYNERTGTFTEKMDLSAGDIIGERMSQVAGTLGKPMQWVENKINRRYTFRLGYAYAWKADSANLTSLKRKFDYKLSKELKRQKRRETVNDLKSDEAPRDFQKFEKNDATEYQYKFEQWRRERAELEANNIVNILHYDYSMPGKSRILGTKVGSILGQFQHYGISYFNLQRNIIREGKEDVFTGNWGGRDAYRMYRLGLLHTAVLGLFAPLLNADVGNLVQNDTLERIDSYHKFVFGNEEEKGRAFFGKGPVLGTFGGPFISDMINLGSLAGIRLFTDNDFMSYLMPMQDELEPGSAEWKRKLLSTLNSQAARTAYSTYPKWREGTNLVVLVQGELGLFPNKEVRHNRQRLNSIAPWIGPKDVRNTTAPRQLSPEELKKQRMGNFQSFLGMDSSKIKVKDPFGTDASVLDVLNQMSK